MSDNGNSAWSLVISECLQSDTPQAIEFQLDCHLNCIDWISDNDIAYGHELGVGILQRTQPQDLKPTEFQNRWCMVKKNLHLGQRVDVLRAHQSLIAAAHPDFSITVVAQRGDQTQTVSLSGTRAHGDVIRSLDISSEGFIASTGDDRYVLVWDDAASNSIPRSYRLAGAGIKVKFWSDNDSDKLIVLESYNKVRILDWRKEEWLLTVYPGHGLKVQDIGVFNNRLLVVGEGWWKAYDLTALSGGCGYTPASQEGRMLLDSQTVNGKVVFGGASGRLAFADSHQLTVLDLNKSSEHGDSIPFNHRQIVDLAFKPAGDAVALANGASIVLANPQQQETEFS